MKCSLFPLALLRTILDHCEKFTPGMAASIRLKSSWSIILKKHTVIA